MTKVNYLRLLIFGCMIALAVGEATKINADRGNNSKEESGCSAAAGSDQCSRSDSRKLKRKKRTLTLPNATSFVIQSRLLIPQLPVGFYLVWIRVRFFIRAMFTDSQISTGSASGSLLASFNKRSAEDGDEVNEEIISGLKRTLAHDQLDIFKRVEDALDRGGLPGRQCVLKTICELKETPINEWTVVGEMIHNLIMPKKDGLPNLDVYRRAEAIGEEHGDCWLYYPDCPFSIFNVIPDVYTKDEQVKVTFEGKHEAPADKDSRDDSTDDYSDPEVEKLLKQFGGTEKDVKEFQVDLDLTKP